MKVISFQSLGKKRRRTNIIYCSKPIFKPSFVGLDNSTALSEFFINSIDSIVTLLSANTIGIKIVDKRIVINK